MPDKLSSCRTCIRSRPTLSRQEKEKKTRNARQLVCPSRLCAAPCTNTRVCIPTAGHLTQPTLNGGSGEGENKVCNGKWKNGRWYGVSIGCDSITLKSHGGGTATKAVPRANPKGGQSPKTPPHAASGRVEPRTFVPRLDVVERVLFAVPPYLRKIPPMSRKVVQACQHARGWRIFIVALSFR